MSIQIIDNRKAKQLIKFEVLPAGQFFITTEGALAQKLLDSTSENNTAVYKDGGLELSRFYKDDGVAPIDVQLVILQDTPIEAPKEESDWEEVDPKTVEKKESPTPQQVEDQPGINVVSITKDSE